MLIHHIALRTDHVEVVAKFYQQNFGLHEHQRFLTDQQTLRSIWLLSGSVIVMVEQRAPDEPRVDPRSLEFVAFALTPDEFALWLARPEHPAIEDRTANTLYFRDPDGRRVGVSKFQTQK